MHTRLFLYLLTFLIVFTKGYSQQLKKEYTLTQVMELAKNQSPDAMLAKHKFRSSYWEYRSFKAELLPELMMNSTLLDFNRSIGEVRNPDGTYTYPEVNELKTMLHSSLTQNIGLTGGNISLGSSLSRYRNIDDSSTSYVTVPLRVTYTQPLSYNPYKWSKKIEPLKYEEAKKKYIIDLEQVSIRAVRYFFGLALAQLNIDIAQINYSNTDTLYKIAQGRYNIGTIAEDELLQMELSSLNAGTALNEALIDLEMRQFQLRSFLGFNDKVDLRLVLPSQIPELEIKLTQALELAHTNNPEILSFQRQLIEAQQHVAQAKSEKNVSGDLYASYGLNKNTEILKQAYTNPLDQQQLTVGIRIPIVDWGERKGRYQMAKSNQEVVRTTVEQARIDFEQEVFLKVMQFNLQDDQVAIAAKADTVANLRYEVTKQRFLIGKINVLDLNIALSEKDVAKRSYISTLQQYWLDYYGIRQLTLYDFEKGVTLTEEYEELID